MPIATRRTIDPLRTAASLPQRWTRLRFYEKHTETTYDGDSIRRTTSHGRSRRMRLRALALILLAPSAAIVAVSAALAGTGGKGRDVPPRRLAGVNFVSACGF